MGSWMKRSTPQHAPFGGFIQVAPAYGAESTERTDVWISYDEDNIYVSARCWDSAPPERWISNELRRDTNQLRQNDHIGVMFDTFYDRRSGFLFYTNPLGALADYSVVDEGGSNTDWNPVWESRTGTFDGGWTVEMAIPFKTLRYRSGPDQMWGIQLRRSIRHKNEWTYLNPVPQNLAGPQAFNRISSGGTLVGLDLPPASRNLEVKPYAIARVLTDPLRVPALDNDFDPDLGGDVKVGLTANLTADFTVNTDFAQVEIDEQQVNLTRFSLFFPEKRDFFLEGRGVFDFARGGAGAQGGGSTDTAAGGAETPYLFYSRRIGLNRNRVIPITVGGRMTGKVGPFGVGVMNIQTGDDAAVVDRRHQFHGGAREARHPAPQHDRRDVHESFRYRRWNRLQPELRYGRGVFLLSERQLQHVLRPHGNGGARGRQRELSGEVRLRGRSVRRAR